MTDLVSYTFFYYFKVVLQKLPFVRILDCPPFGRTLGSENPFRIAQKQSWGIIVVMAFCWGAVNLEDAPRKASFGIAFAF